MRRAVLLACLLLPGRAFAFGAGVFGYSGKPPAQSCTQCHSGGAPPMVTLTGPTKVAVGTSGVYALDVVTAASGHAAGFDVAASDGVLGTVSQANESWINNGELSHTKTWPTGKQIRVQLTLTPSAPGPITLFANALDSDATDDPGGDGVASTTFALEAVSGADLAGVDLAGADLASGEDLATVDAVSGASTMAEPKPDLGPPHDEARWACACDVGGRRAPASATGPLALVVLATALLRRARAAASRRR